MKALLISLAVLFWVLFSVDLNCTLMKRHPGLYPYDIIVAATCFVMGVIITALLLVGAQ